MNTYNIYSVKSNAESPLLRLPAEIRNLIWSFACGGQLVTTTYSFFRLGDDNKGGAFCYLTDKDLVANAQKSRDLSDYFRRPVRVASAFQLPRVCRQIYSETALRSYRDNTFFLHSTIASEYGSFERLMAAQRRAITTVELRSDILYATTWCGFTGLRDILGVQTILPSVRTLVLSKLAVRYIELDYKNYQPDRLFARYQRTEEEWKALIVHELRISVAASIEIRFED